MEICTGLLTFFSLKRKSGHHLTASMRRKFTEGKKMSKKAT
jgi:hypothetical protein